MIISQFLPNQLPGDVFTTTEFLYVLGNTTPDFQDDLFLFDSLPFGSSRLKSSRIEGAEAGTVGPALVSPYL